MQFLADFDQLARAMVARVASPEHWPDDSSLVIVRGDALGNAYRTSAYQVRRDLARIGRPRDRGRWEISPADFDAYNERVDNTITVSAPELHPPFFDPNADDATNFGAIGSVIAHEMTHGFDDQGRLRDGEGALHDWWTPEDARRFEERAKCLRDEYSAFIAVDDVHVNGDRTISENIADNGGLRIALRALHEVLRAKGTENQRIDRLTPDQRFFLSYAHIWCGGSSPAVLREKA
jgi:endothelin-converting enzyme/putative endopeptidase